MKTFTVAIICLLFTVSPNITFSQIPFNSNPEMVHTLNYLKENRVNKNKQEGINEIYIQQIGNQNNINSEIASSSKQVSLYQDGNFNYINLSIKARSYTNNIIQTGDYNNIFEHIYSPSNNISLNLTQSGHNNHFERFGSNSIGDKLEFSIQGNDQAIIVRNFK